MNKKTAILLTTLILEVALTLALSIYFHTSFISLMFFIGLFFIGIALLFSSKGGLLANFNSSTAQAQTGIPQPYERLEMKAGPFLIGAGIYFFIGLIFFILLLNGFIH